MSSGFNYTDYEELTLPPAIIFAVLFGGLIPLYVYYMVKKPARATLLLLIFVTVKTVSFILICLLVTTLPTSLPLYIAQELMTSLCYVAIISSVLSILVMHFNLQPRSGEALATRLLQLALTVSIIVIINSESINPQGPMTPVGKAFTAVYCAIGLTVAFGTAVNLLWFRESPDRQVVTWVFVLGVLMAIRSGYVLISTLDSTVGLTQWLAYVFRTTPEFITAIILAIPHIHDLVVMSRAAAKDVTHGPSRHECNNYPQLFVDQV